MWAEFRKNLWFGLSFGIGFICAYGVLKLLLWLIGMITSGDISCPAWDNAPLNHSNAP